MTQRRILLGVTGGVAAYKALELVRGLRKHGAVVRVVMTAAAQRFVTPLSFQALTGQSVHTELWDEGIEQAMGHIQLARWADTLLVAPATADVLAKFSCGLADDLLTTLFLVAECPVFVAPAMNQAMWRKAVVQQHVVCLQQRGVKILGPDCGEQACGDEGPGRLLAIEEIVRAVLESDVADCHAKPLDGVTVMITAGPTREPIDPVRFISNRSSGKMGYALATAACKRGARVILVTGPTTLPIPQGVIGVRVETAEEMYCQVMAHITECQLFIAAAAVSDYTPAQRAIEKIKKQQTIWQLSLQRTTDILARVAALDNPPFTVGFAAETHDLTQYAQSKLLQKNLDMIAANHVSGAQGGFDSDDNALHVFWRDGQTEWPMMPKTQLAERLIDLIAHHFRAKEARCA